MQTMSITELRRDFEAVVDAVSAPGGHPVTITRRGKPVVVLIGDTEWRELQRDAGLPEQ